MVGLKTLSSLLLAASVAPSVFCNPINANAVLDLVARAPQGGIELPPLLGGGGSSGDTSSSPADQQTTTPPSTSASPTPTTVSTPPPVTTSSAPPVTTTPPSTQPPTTSQPPQQTTSSPPPTTSSPPPQTTASPTESVLLVYTSVYTTTGHVVTATLSTSVPTSTAAPQQKAEENHGATPAQIGGAVGGACGLVLVIALAAVAWRVWGKNRRRSEEDDGLMDDGIYGTSEVKAHNGGTGASPFQNNLEQYHTPGRTNPSANF